MKELLLQLISTRVPFFGDVLCLFDLNETPNGAKELLIAKSIEVSIQHLSFVEFKNIFLRILPFSFSLLSQFYK